MLLWERKHDLFDSFLFHFYCLFSLSIYGLSSLFLYFLLKQVSNALHRKMDRIFSVPRHYQSRPHHGLQIKEAKKTNHKTGIISQYNRAFHFRSVLLKREVNCNWKKWDRIGFYLKIVRTSISDHKMALIATYLN